MQQSRLLRHGLRLYVDPESSVSGPQFWLDLNEVQLHTQQLGTPCSVHLCVPDDGRSWTSWSVPHLEFERARSSGVAAGTAAVAANEAFPGTEEHYIQARGLASAALANDCDVVLSASLAARPEIAHAFQKLEMELVDEQGARTAVEIFMRGHEIPWGFGLHMWQWPWVGFYPNVESGIRLMDRLRGKAAEVGASHYLLEYMRSLGFSRWSALAYTRDKLLFFALQRRAAKRNQVDLQDFSFELSYYLSHYYFLLWGGLEQVCWIANESCGLGFTAKERMQVGVGRKDFLRRLEARAPEVATEFDSPDFLEWLRRLKLVRHHSSHQGFPMLAPLFAVPAIVPTQDEIDREIETWPEWLEMKDTFEPGMLEAFRPVLRNRWIERNYQLLSDAALGIPDGSQFSAVSPLQHITGDFKIFQEFTLRVVELCVARLSSAHLL